jgi:hypothetical protein
MCKYMQEKYDWAVGHDDLIPKVVGPMHVLRIAGRTGGKYK